MPNLGHAVLALALLVAGASRAAAAPDATVSQGHEGRTPAIASDDKGGLHVVYEAFAKGSKVPDIFYSASSDAGTTWSPGVNVSRTPGSSTEPAIACGKGGAVVIVWIDTTSGADRPDVFGVSSSDGGKTWSPAANVSNTTGRSSEPAVAIGHDGAVHVVWADTTDGATSPDTWHAASRDRGATWSKAANLSQTPGSSSNPAVETGPKGEVYVCWTDTTSGVESPDIYFALSTDGTTFDAPIDVSNTPGVSSVPEIAVDDQGIYLVWRDTSAGAKHPDIYVAASNDGGRTFGKPTPVAETPGVCGDPVIVAAEGRLVVVWSDTSDVDVPDIWMSVSTDHGKTWGKARNASRTPGDSRFPDVTVANGHAFVIWQEDEKGASRVSVTGVPLK